MVCCLVSESAAGDARLADIARACSPRVESHGTRVVVFDASGLGRVIGTPIAIAREVQALARDQGLGVRVALATTRVTAWLIAHARPGITVIEPAHTASALAALPVSALSTLARSLSRQARVPPDPLDPRTLASRPLGPSAPRTLGRRMLLSP